MPGALPTLKLSPNVKALCGKVAHEKHRPAVWATAANMRAEALARLRAGDTEAEVLAWLGTELGKVEAPVVD